MEKIKKFFGEFNMTWPRVIVFAVLAGAYTAVMALIPALQDTSFHDIAVYPECWILFAVFIVVNCKTWWEASLKCFVFFLISQPLVYLIQVPFFRGGWEIFQYYRYWFFVTLLVLPGAAIAFLVKKKNWLSVLVLSVATGFLAYSSVTYLTSALARFPRHLLSAIFCLALAVFFIFVLLDKKKHRLAALAVVAAVFIAFAAVTGLGLHSTSTELLLEEGEWTCEVEDDSIVSVEITDGTHAKLSSKGAGNTVIRFKNAAGVERVYDVTVNGGQILLFPWDEE